MLPASGLQRRLGDPLHSTVSATCGPVHLSGIPARGAEARCDAIPDASGGGGVGSHAGDNGGSTLASTSASSAG